MRSTTAAPPALVDPRSAAPGLLAIAGIALAGWVGVQATAAMRR